MRCYSNRAAPTAGGAFPLGTLAVRAWEGDDRPSPVQMPVLSATQSAQGAWTVLLESANPAGVFLRALEAAAG